MFKKLALHFLKGILAGLSIGLGGFLYVLMRFLINGELGSILGSLLFAVGLFIVCTFSLSLYTGKIGLIFEEKKDLTFYLSLPIMLVGNAIGAIGLGYIFYFIFKDNADPNFMVSATNIANSRLVYNDFVDYLSTAIKSFLCGFCVYMAVKLFALNRLKPLGILSLVFFVFVFVYAGFQHCIANMFYFGLANRFVGETFINLALVIIFNSFGPIMGVVAFKLIKSAKSKK